MTETKPMKLAEFLTARIDEDEATARAACIPASDRYLPHPELTIWRYVEDEEVIFDYNDGDSWPRYVTMDNEGIHASVSEVTGRHIARHDPARVLAECEAKRRIVEGLQNILRDAPEQADGTALRGYVEALWVVVQELAAVYADHPDYRPGWKP